MKEKKIKIDNVMAWENGVSFLSILSSILFIFGILNYPKIIEGFKDHDAFVTFYVFLIIWFISASFLIFLIREKMKTKKFISSSVHSLLGQWRWIEVIKLKDGQIFIFDRENQVLLNATKNDLEKMFRIKLPEEWRGEEMQESNFIVECILPLEIDESSKVDLPISLDITLNSGGIKPEELCKFFTEDPNLIEEKVVIFSDSLFDVFLSHKDNLNKIKEAVMEKMEEKISFFEMKEKIADSVSFPNIFSSFKEIIFDIEDISFLKKRNILKK